MSIVASAQPAHTTTTTTTATAAAAASTATQPTPDDSASVARTPEAALQQMIRAAFEEADMPERAKHPLPIYPPGQSMNLYREVFFAGFPCLNPHESMYKGVAGGIDAVRDTVIYSGKTIFSAFQAYGKLDKFFYDPRRGMGCVVFHKGEDAESCFLSMNNAVIPGPVGDPNIKGPQEVTQVGFGSFESPQRGGPPDGAGTNNRHGRVRDYIITCEFARCLPFVTPALLLKDEFGALELSRGLMRHFPVPESAAGARLGEWVVAAWVKTRVVNTSGNGDGAGHSVPPTAASVTDQLLFVGPMFSDGPQDQENPVLQAMFRALKPSHFIKKEGTQLALVELWWEYYHTYILNKTEPPPSRIRSKREFLSATCATITQEILALKKDCYESNMRLEHTAPNSLLRRLVFDDVFHSTLNAIIIRQQFKLDPAFTSFLRDVYSERTIQEYEKYRAKHPFRPDVDTVRLLRQIDKTLTQADRGNDAEVAKTKRRCFTEEDAKLQGKRVRLQTSLGGEAAEDGAGGAALGGATEEENSAEQKADARADIEYSLLPKVQEWMAMPLLEVTSNVIDNIRYLRKIKKGLVNPDGSERAQPGKHPAAAAGEEEIDYNYPAPSLQQEDADLFDEITTNLNGFCADGSLFSLLLLGESPATFRGEKHHLGYEENYAYHNQSRGKLWKDCKDVAKALVVPVIFLACIVMLVNYVVGKSPAEDTTVGTYWGQPEKRPNYESREDSTRRFARDHHHHSGSGNGGANGERATAAERSSTKPRRRPALKPTTTAVDQDERSDDAKPTAGVGTAGDDGGSAEGLDTQKAKEWIARFMEEANERTPEEVVEAQRQAAQRARELMQKAKDEAAKRGGRFNIGFSADL